MKYYVRNWVLVTHERMNGLVKVLSTTSNGWRLNSGIESVEKVGHAYQVHGYSGSIYVCDEAGEACHSLYGANILNSMFKQGFTVLTMEEYLNGGV